MTVLLALSVLLDRPRRRPVAVTIDKVEPMVTLP